MPPAHPRRGLGRRKKAADLEGLHLPLAADLDCCIVSVDYRLAPETRFPGAVEDCYAALAWLLTNADDVGIDAARVGVIGESAGGGLAAALALLVRDRGAHRLAFQHLIYPMLDDRTCVRREPNPFHWGIRVERGQQPLRTVVASGM